MLHLVNPASENKFYGLDHLRAFAILYVMCFHYPVEDLPDWLWDIKDFGWTGVDLFFVLSGFLIAKQLFENIQTQKINWLLPFFVKRVLRIFPVFFLVVALYFIFPAIRETKSLPPLWNFLTFTQNIGLNPGTHGAFSHAWSLCVEEQFYLLFPVILFLLTSYKIEKSGKYLLLFLFLFTCFFRLFLWYNNIAPVIKSEGEYSDFWITWIYYPTYTRLDGLLIGIAIAAIYIFLPALKTKILKYGNLLFISGTLILIGAYFLNYNRVSFSAIVFGFPIIAVGYGFWVLSAISPSSFLYQLKSSLTAFIATLSFSMYLIHKSVRYLCHKHLSILWAIDKDSVLMFFICLAATFLLALLLRYIVEKPALKLRDYLLHKLNAA